MAVCPEYQRLADAFRAALERVYPLQEQREKAIASKDISGRQAVAILLNDARREAREAERALNRHAENHRCGPPSKITLTCELAFVGGEGHAENMATPIEPCDDYWSLADALTEAIQQVRALENESWEAFRSKDFEKAREIGARLTEARSTARAGILALRRHASAHGCGPSGAPR